MTEELFFASETISGINFDIVVSNDGIRKILINKKSEELAGVEKVTTENSLVANVFKQLKEYNL
jgi:hypothetical protein